MRFKGEIPTTLHISKNLDELRRSVAAQKNVEQIYRMLNTPKLKRAFHNKTIHKTVYFYTSIKYKLAICKCFVTFQQTSFNTSR